MNINMISGSSMVINGQTFSGNNIVIRNGKVIVDGVEQDNTLTGDINVTVNGDVESIENGAGNITAHNVGSAKTGSGDINCGDISGSVRTGSGDVKCKNVSGSISTGSGNILHSSTTK